MNIKSYKKVKRALISVYEKEPTIELVNFLHALGVEIVSTGGTLRFIRDMGIPAVAVEEITGYPSILDGRVKTLHPGIFAGILARSARQDHVEELGSYSILPFDMVVVDLYPFQETLASGASHEEIIEKIDIGGISLIRAAAKNHEDVLVVPSSGHYHRVMEVMTALEGGSSLEERRKMAALAMGVSAGYDHLISAYLAEDSDRALHLDFSTQRSLRYGENPHQKAAFYGDLDNMFEQLHGKALSYNNLLDIDAAMGLIGEFSDPAFAIIKHTNPCGVAVRDDIELAWEAALAGDPVSAFGGILVANRPIGADLALRIRELFFEVLIAPDFEGEALSLLAVKKNRILLKSKSVEMPSGQYRSALNGMLWQGRDQEQTAPSIWNAVTRRAPSKEEVGDLLFANIVVKHLKSNAIALVKDSMLMGSGMGQTSRVDALNHAVAKAISHGHELLGGTMASDAFFPFPDCVKIASEHGITAVIQPGGSVKDQDSIDYCDNAGMAMVLTGNRHFKH